MRIHSLFSILLFSFSLLISGVANAQQQQEKPVLIDGKSYYMHTVERGHTLYSIAKSYGVAIEDVIKENPRAEAGVKVGEKLKIPVAKMDKNTDVVKPKIEAEYLIHTVAPKETVFSLSKKYDVSTADLVEANPSINQGLRDGQQIKIPVLKAKTDSFRYLSPADDGNLLSHRVQKGETLFSLAQRFSVSVDEIKNANGGLKEGLRDGLLIKIPNAETKKAVDIVKPKTETITPPITTIPVNTFETKPAVLPAAKENNKKNEGAYKVAILLPFDSEKLDSLDKLGHEQIALEFYQGALIALDSLKSLGVEMEVYVKDTKKDAATVRALLSKPDMANIDLFIGPLYKSELLALTDHAEKIGAHIVCPVPQSGGILVNKPYLSKAHCDEATQVKALSKYVLKNFPRENILVIRPSASNPEKLGAFFLSAWKVGGNAELIQDLVTDQPTLTLIEEKLKAGRNNVVYVGSNQLSYVSGILSKLNGISGKYEITVIGNEDWIKFDQIESATKNRLNLHLPISHYIDYDNAFVKSFLSNYRERYNTDPNKYAHLGYDITFYYLYGMWSQGRAFLETLAQSNVALTATKMQMQRPNPSSGFDNFGTFIVRYNDYKLEILR